jgi:hypothetical protein
MASGFSDYCPIQLAYTDTVPAFDPSLTVFKHTSVVPNNPGGNGKGPSATQFSVPVVEKGGNLDVSYANEECNSSIDHAFKFQQSTDGGATFMPNPVKLTHKATFKDNPDPADLLPNTAFRAPNTESLAYSDATGTLLDQRGGHRRPALHRRRHDLVEASGGEHRPCAVWAGAKRPVLPLDRDQPEG